MMRIAHGTHRWDYRAEACRQCACAASSQAAVEPCPAAAPKAQKPTTAPTQESLNRALTQLHDRTRT